MERKTIHRSHWQSQLIEVVDEGDTRSLYFGGHVLQSSMYLSAPQKLALSYTRFMAAPLLIDDAPERILVVGVGAGSLVRFFHHHFPDARIDGIAHYAVPNIPGTVARTASQALTLAVRPYVEAIAEKGCLAALRGDPALRRGLTAVAGSLTWHEAGTFLGRSWEAPEKALGRLP